MWRSGRASRAGPLESGAYTKAGYRPLFIRLPALIGPVRAEVVDTMVRVPHRMLAALVFVGIVAVAAYADLQLTVHALVQSPNRYDGKVVIVVGTIAAYRDRVSEGGHPYTVFLLTDGPASVTVFIWNKHGFGNGDRVRVTGTFLRARPVGTVTQDHEIQAHRIEAAP